MVGLPGREVTVRAGAVSLGSSLGTGQLMMTPTCRRSVLCLRSFKSMARGFDRLNFQAQPRKLVFSTAESLRLFRHSRELHEYGRSRSLRTVACVFLCRIDLGRFT